MDHLNAAVLAGSTSLVAQSMTTSAPWWLSLLYSVGAAIAGAVLNWLLRQGPPPPPQPTTLSESGGGA